MISAKDAKDLQYFYKRLEDITFCNIWKINYLDLCNAYPDIVDGIEKINMLNIIIKNSLDKMVKKSILDE